MKHLKGLFIILLIAFLGELLNKILHIPLPGTVLGMIILLICLVTKIVKLEDVEEISYFLLTILPFLFVPSGTGLINCMDLIKKNLIPIVVIILISTLVVFFVTGIIVQLLKGVSNERANK